MFPQYTKNHQSAIIKLPQKFHATRQGVSWRGAFLSDARSSNLCPWLLLYLPCRSVFPLTLKVTCSLFCFLAVPPEIVKHPQNISIDEGDTIILQCEARGFPVPQITWYLNDTAVLTNSSVVEIIEARKSYHEGLYRCEARNPAGIVTASAYVTVGGPCNGSIFHN